MAFGLTSFRVALAALALVSVASCSDDDDDNNNTPAATTSMSWTVDGANATAVRVEAADSTTYLAVQGTTTASGAGNAVVLAMPKKVGTYALSLTPGATSAGALYATASATDTTAYLGLTGSVVVTTYTASTTKGASNAVGTFTFTAADFGGGAPKNLTNGKFNVKF